MTIEAYLEEIADEAVSFINTTDLLDTTIVNLTSMMAKSDNEWELIFTFIDADQSHTKVHILYDDYYRNSRPGLDPFFILETLVKNYTNLTHIDIPTKERAKRKLAIHLIQKKYYAFGDAIMAPAINCWYKDRIRDKFYDSLEYYYKFIKNMDEHDLDIFIEKISKWNVYNIGTL